MLRHMMRNGFWGVGGAGVGRVLNLLGMIFVARSLGVIEYGSLGLIISTLGVFGVLAGGSMGSTATRYVAALKTEDPKKLGEIMGMIWLVSAAFSFLFFFMVVLLSEVIAQHLLQRGGIGKQYYIIAGASVFCIMSFRSVQDAILAGFEKFRDIAVIKLIEGIMIFLLMPALAQAYGVAGALIGMFLGYIPSLIIGFLLVSSTQKFHGIKNNYLGIFNQSEILRSYSIPSLLSNIVGTPVIALGVWWLSREPEGIIGSAHYNAAYQWHGPLIFAPMVLSSVAMPIMVQYWSSGNTIKFKKLFFLTCVASFLISLFPAIGVIALCEEIIQSYGDGFQGGQSALIWLALAAPMHVTSNVCASALKSMDKAWLVMKTTQSWALIFILLVWFLVPIYGGAGLAIALMTSYLVQTSIRVVWINIILKRINPS